MTDTEDEQLFDVLIPPGVPQKIIFDVTNKFDVKVVERMEPLKFANMEGEERELLAFRGKMDEVKKVEKYMIEQLKAFIDEK
ncbi:hypothetical protein [Methanoregula sp.]|uniref:hypothetical protein n=1 Tax=Methanoregula sp. TaxID=2052170 RepID=UPI00236CBC67|nr:hypothetical protein [Methanoregula sp.]MDD1687634.1 hypothetical protein [Methanoregula sp.]